MRIRAAIPLLLPLILAGSDGGLSIPIRGRTQAVVHISPAIPASRNAVLFLPGDGGWRGAAITMGRAVASWGYDVYGFDTKQYLEAFSSPAPALSREQMADDIRALSASIANASHRTVILIGWSQGAGMAVAAGAGVPDRNAIKGVLTLGLPESAVLGWDWKATLAVIARREPDQPKFAIKPLLSQLTPMPVWMIHGSDDQFTCPDTAQDLYSAAKEPKHLERIPGANHRFDGHQTELFHSMKEGLAWISGR
jgi:uncharacterized protein